MSGESLTFPYSRKGHAAEPSCMSLARPDDERITAQGLTILVGNLTIPVGQGTSAFGASEVYRPALKTSGEPADSFRYSAITLPITSQ